MDRHGALKSHIEKLGVIFQLSFFYSLCLKASEASQKTRKFANQYSLHYLSLISPCWQLCYPFVFCPIQEKMSTSHPVLHAGKQDLRGEAVLFCEVPWMHQKTWRRKRQKVIHSTRPQEMIISRNTKSENEGEICLYKFSFTSISVVISEKV